MGGKLLTPSPRLGVAAALSGGRMTATLAGSSDQDDRLAQPVAGPRYSPSEAMEPLQADPWSGLAMQDFRFGDGRPSAGPRWRPPVRAIVNWSVFALVCVAVWFVAGPAQLGGPVDYVIVDGPSMEPTYQEGDLVIARAKESYAVGDVVAYLPDIGLRFPVIHRIVEIAGDGQYVTKGDNRDEVDGWLASDANIFGAEWLHIPYAGTVLVYLRQPAPWLAAAAGLFALGFLTRTGQGRPQKTRLEQDHP